MHTYMSYLHAWRCFNHCGLHSFRGTLKTSERSAYFWVTCWDVAAILWSKRAAAALAINENKTKYRDFRSTLHELQTGFSPPQQLFIPVGKAQVLLMTLTKALFTSSVSMSYGTVVQQPRYQPLQTKVAQSFIVNFSM